MDMWQRTLGILLAFHLHLSDQQVIRTGIFSSQPIFDNLFPSVDEMFLTPVLGLERFGCAHACQKFDLCKGFMSKAETKECRLLKDSLNETTTFSVSQGWRYFNRNSDCGIGWYQYGDHCYLYNETLVTFNDAKLFCEQRGAYIIEVNDIAENNWITAKYLIADSCSQVQLCSTWNGAIKSGTGQYFWSYSNTLVMYFFWQAGEPTGGGGIDCINMRPNGQWNDAFCSGQFKILCEKSL